MHQYFLPRLTSCYQPLQQTTRQPTIIQQ
jgi:hypothetical protein